MKKNLLITASIIAVLAALGISTFAYAQSQMQSDYPYVMGDYGDMMAGGYGDMMAGDYGDMMGDGYGDMMGDGYGDMMGDGYNMMDDYGDMLALHDYMEASMSAALGLTSAEMDARHEAGNTFWDIAADQGLTTDEATALMLTARDNALTQALADGAITQDFADWMISYSDAMTTNGYGPDSDHCNQTGYDGREGNDL